MADQGGWNVVSSTPLKAEAPAQAAGGWNVVSSVPDEPAQPVAAPVAAPVPNASGLVSPQDADASAQQFANVTAQHVMGTGQTIGGTQPSLLQRLIAPFTGPGSAYGAAESRRTGGPAENQFDKPLIDFRANDQFVDGPPIVRGFTKAVQSGLSGLTTPKNAALLIGMFGIGSLPVIGKLISAGFAGDMLYSAAKQSPQLKAQIKAGDVEGAAETATGMGINVGMAGLSVAHALKPGERAAPAPPATANSTGTEPYAPVQAPVQSTVQTPVQPAAAPVEPPVVAAPVVTAEPVKAPRKPKTKKAAPVAEPAQPIAAPAAPVEGWNVVKSEPLPKEKTHETQTTVTARVPATGTDGKPAAGVGEPEAKAEGGEKPVEKSVLKPEQTAVTAPGREIKLNEFHAARGGFANPARLVVTSAQTLTSEDIRQNFFQGHDISVEKLTPSVFTGQGNPNTQLFKIQFHASGGAHIDAPAGIEESLGLKPNERFMDKPVTGMPGQRPAAAPVETKTLPAETKAPIVETKPKGAETPAPKIETPAAAQPAQPVAAGVAAAESPVESKHVPDKAESEQPAGQRQEVPGTRGPGHPVAYGAETEIFAEGRDQPYKARYAVRELSDTYPSHNPFSFEPHPDFHYINDRDYSLPANRQRVVNASGPRFRPVKVINDNPDAINGPSVIERDGNVLGGNNRRMALERVYSLNPKGAAEYRALLIKKAGQFGIDPAAIDSYKQPVLVRELDEAELDPQHAISEFNYSPAGGHSIGERAAADARGMTPETGKYLASVMEGAGPDATLTDVLNGKRGPEVVNHLIRAGIFTENERPELLDATTGAVTSDAKQRIAKMLLGGLFKNSEDFQAAEPSLRNKLERIAGILKQLEGRQEWNLTPDVKQAVEAISFERDYGKAYGIKPGESYLIKAPQSEHQGAREFQAGMFGDAPAPPEISERAKVLGDFIRANNPTSIGRAFRSFAEKSNEKSLFGEPDPAEAFAQEFGADPRRGAVSLDLLTLGAAKFITSDVAPALRDAAQGIRDTSDDIMKVLAPTLRSPESKTASLILRGKLAELARKSDQARAALETASKYFRSRPAAENFDFIDRMELGQRQASTDLDHIAFTLRRLLDDKRADVQSLGTGKLKTFYQDYFPHIWEKPGRAATMFAAFFGKRPLEGGKSFLKKRKLPTIADGRAVGLKPVTDNPVDLVLLKVHEMDRYVMAHETLADWKTNGLAKFVRGAKPPPKGWAAINDSIGTVYGRNAADETIIRGHYYAPEGAARIINNYLAPGLREFGAYRAILGLNNVLNQFQLGLSAFHLGFTAADTTVSKAALGYQALLTGHPLKAAKFFAETPTAAFTTFLKGDKLLKEWYKPGSQGAAIGKIADDLVTAGGRARMDQMYRTQIGEKMYEALRNGNILGAALRAPFAGTEFLSNLLMNEVVPRMKLGAFADLAKFHMEELGPNATFEQTRLALTQDWNSVENRLGEMTYDNLFWDKTAKDIAMISVRSVGWNIGTLREIGGGIGDVVAQPYNKLKGEPVNLNRLSYILGLVTVNAVMSATYQYLKTGKGPDELKDYFFPKNGETDEQGRPQRISWPTYVKDVYHYSTHPLKTIENKVAPIWSMFAEMIHNSDFYRQEIRHPDDPLVAQLAQLAEHVAKTAVPIGVRNYQRETKLGSSLSTRAEQFVGVSPAPAELNQSPAERIAREISASHASGEPRTAEAAARSELRQSLTRSLHQGKGVPADVKAARRAGTFSNRDWNEAVRAAKEDPLQRAFLRMGIRDACKVYTAATPEEKKWLQPMLARKAKAAHAAESRAEWKKTLELYRAAIAK